MAKEVKTKSKNKNKNLNKVKIFLANPSKPKCPSLENEDLQHLERILKEIINNSELTPRSFATLNHISIGLESTLRSIKNGTAGCIFLSANIKPRYLLGLITRNAEVKDATIPTYTEKNLEDFVQRIFGVKTLALVIPKTSSSFSSELGKWIESHRRKITNKQQIKSSVHKENPKRKIQETSNLHCEQFKNTSNPAGNVDVEKKLEAQQWGSRYISFSNITSESMKIDEANSEKDEEKLLNTLTKMASKVKETTEKPQFQLSHASNEEEVKSAFEIKIDSNEDDFFVDYKPLVVHKICPNPERKPRKKRKKKVIKTRNSK